MLNLRSLVRDNLPAPLLAAYRSLRSLRSGSVPVPTTAPDPKTAPIPPGFTDYRSIADPLYAPWLTNKDFVDLYARVLDDVGKGPTSSPEVPSSLFLDGRYIQWAMARNALRLRGDYVEIGVHQATASHLFGLILDQEGALDRTLWSIDSFEGLSEPDERDIDVRSGEQFFKKHSLDDVNVDFIRALLGSHASKSRVVKGWIPDVFEGLDIGPVAFAHIDVDIYQPTMDALQYIWDRIVPGGTVLFDDYGFPMCVGARSAVDAFFEARPETVVALPTGQAFVIKH